MQITFQMKNTFQKFRSKHPKPSKVTFKRKKKKLNYSIAKIRKRNMNVRVFKSLESFTVSLIFRHYYFENFKFTGKVF